eukprot:SAG31_NODE_2736_length_5167_cov_4.773283_1_plen_65_part_00
MYSQAGTRTDAFGCDPCAMPIDGMEGQSSERLNLGLMVQVLTEPAQVLSRYLGTDESNRTAHRV